MIELQHIDALKDVKILSCATPIFQEIIAIAKAIKTKPNTQRLSRQYASLLPSALYLLILTKVLV
jgi:hypothetical protein